MLQNMVLCIPKCKLKNLVINIMIDKMYSNVIFIGNLLSNKIIVAKSPEICANNKYLL